MRTSAPALPPGHLPMALSPSSAYGGITVEAGSVRLDPQTRISFSRVRRFLRARKIALLPATESFAWPVYRVSVSETNSVAGHPQGRGCPEALIA